MIDLESLTDTFTQATTDANGYQTAFHAGTAAIMQQIGKELLAIRRERPERLTEALLRLATHGKP